MVEYDGKTYERDGRGKYRCPNDPCSQKHPDYPRPSWVSEKGFLKHLEECKANIWSPVPRQEREVFGYCPDCGNTIWKMESYWEMRDGYVCITCYRPYFEKGKGFHAPAGLELPGITLEA